MKHPIAVFASGTGSNFEAIHDAILAHTLNAEIVLLVCDKPSAVVIQKAKDRSIPVLVVQPKKFVTKITYEEVILTELRKKGATFIVLAGYMRMIGMTLLNAYPKRIINIHPSLLPAFKGLDAIGQAMTAKVPITGVSIHYIDEGMDTGEIIAQRAISISNLHTREEIETQIHQIEHELYPQTIQKVLEELQ